MRTLIAVLFLSLLLPVLAFGQVGAPSSHPGTGAVATLDNFTGFSKTIGPAGQGAAALPDSTRKRADSGGQVELHVFTRVNLFVGLPYYELVTVGPRGFTMPNQPVAGLYLGLPPGSTATIFRGPYPMPSRFSPFAIKTYTMPPAGLVGYDVILQYLLLLPGLNPLGYATSDGLEFEIY